MQHSVLITHRNRHDNLSVCLRSLAISAERIDQDLDELEIVIADNGSGPWSCCYPDWLPVRWIRDKREMPIFNKPVLWNVAIEESRGDVITFLDADAVVGSYFLGTIALLDECDRIAYRVRYIDEAEAGMLHRHKGMDYLRAWIESTCISFDRRETKGHGFEWTSIVEGVNHGNSQMSLRRETLGDVRYDEQYVGRGSEDLAFIRELIRSLGPRHNVKLITTPHCSMFHLQHAYSEDWNDRGGQFIRDNKARYAATGGNTI